MMKTQEAQAVLDNIMGHVFGYKNEMTLEIFQQKFAFDVRLPIQVNDSVTGEVTWASSANASKYMTMENARKFSEDKELIPTQPIPDIQTLLGIWNQTNYMSTERQMESINVSESDSVSRSQNVYRSLDVSGSKNIVFCDGAHDCEFMAATQRSINSTFSVKVDDSQNINESFFVTWSNKVSKSFFINDCFDVTDCMFCTNIAGKQYCVANMQLTKADYDKVKDMVTRWILSS